MYYEADNERGDYPIDPRGNQTWNSKLGGLVFTTSKSFFIIKYDK